MDNERIVISKEGVKREIRFPFEICLSREAAGWLRDQLKQADHEEFCYGWITIAHPVDMKLTAGQPLPWTETRD